MEYNFYLDKKITTWKRGFIKIDAKDYDTAEKLAISGFEGFVYVEPHSYENLSETEQYITLADNDEFSTQELYNEDDILIKQNGKSYY